METRSGPPHPRSGRRDGRLILLEWERLEPAETVFLSHLGAELTTTRGPVLSSEHSSSVYLAELRTRVASRVRGNWGVPTMSREERFLDPAAPQQGCRTRFPPVVARQLHRKRSFTHRLTFTPRRTLSPEGYVFKHVAVGGGPENPDFWAACLELC